MTSVDVFGDPVTDGDVLERAQKAYSEPNAGGKRDQAISYVNSQKESFGNGVSTLSIFYNATGETLVYVRDQNYYGEVYSKYPTRVQNGQWGAFLHTKQPVVASGSMAYVIYRVKTSDTKYCHQLLGWETPWLQTSYPNRAYCEILDDGVFPDPKDVYGKMEAAGRQHTAFQKSMFTSSSIGQGTSPTYEAILTLDTGVEATTSA